MKPVHKLAKQKGVQLSYTNAFGKRKSVPDSTIVSILSSMGYKTDNESIKKELNKPSPLLEPVTVAWNGILKLPINTNIKNLEFSLLLEHGESYNFKINSFRLPKVKDKKLLYLKDALPYGYHKLHVKAGKTQATALIISAPMRAYSTSNKHFGFFAPVYALNSKTSEGIGDFKDMEKMLDWVKKQGDVFSTLPLNSTFLEPFNEISPYSPSSLQFYNELYVNIKSMPELHECGADKLLNKHRSKFRELNKKENVDYNSVYKIKRQILESMADKVFTKGIRKQEFNKFIKQNPGVKAYARHRAKLEKKQKAYRYYLYAQWKAHEQVQGVVKKAKEKGVKLKLDFPVGVHPYSLEAYKNKSYISNVQIGAPPDPNFLEGQNWGFPAPGPERIRENGYANFIRAIKKQMSLASFLRIDHIMGLHRLFWIPENITTASGTYVQYNSDEFYAILCLESNRNKCVLFGENLGTVPSYVNKKMQKHNIGGFSVFQFLINGLPSIPRENVACLNTHDTPTFAGFLEGKDIKEGRKNNYISKSQETTELKRREKAINKLVKDLKRKKSLREYTKKGLLHACIKNLSQRESPLVIVNTEDLWLEKKQQNKPGTVRGNWQHKLKYSIESLF